MDEITLLRDLAPHPSGPSDTQRAESRRRLEDVMERSASSTPQRRRRRRVAAIAAIGACVVTAGAAAATLMSEDRNPGADRARTIESGNADLVVDEATGQACLVSRSGRASGSSCTSTAENEVLVSVLGGPSTLISVYDPTQRATKVRQGDHDAERRTVGARTYFVILDGANDEPVEVLDSSGNVIARHDVSAE